MKKHVLFAALALFLLRTTLMARAQEKVDLSQSQMPSVITVPPEALPSSHFDIGAATKPISRKFPLLPTLAATPIAKAATGPSSGIF